MTDTIFPELDLNLSDCGRNRTVEVIRNNDPKSFVQVTPLLQVYGRFFVKPVK